MLSPVEEIKARVDIVEFIQGYIRLQKAGVNYKAVCPFHSEKTPSFFVSPVKQIWHCFSCGKGGDVFTFVMELEGQEFPEALKLLAAKARVELKREDPAIRSEKNRLYEINEEAAKVFQYLLSKTPAAIEYIKGRGLTSATVAQFRVGYSHPNWDFLTKHLMKKGFRAEEIERAGLAIKSERSAGYDRFRSRIMFPITDANGRVIGFGGRIVHFGGEKPQREEPKYINTPQTVIYDKSRVLYAFDKAKQEIRVKNKVVIVEGYMDCVMAHQAGTSNTIAVSGTALTTPQLQTLRRLCDTMICSFDTDAAGESATRRSLALAAEFGFERAIARIPSGKDPADAIVENADAWREAIDEAKGVIEFYMDKAFASFDPRTAMGKKQITDMVLPFVAAISDEIQKSHWAGDIARKLSVPEAAILTEMNKLKQQAGSGSVHVPRQIAEKGAAPSRRERLEERYLTLLAMMSGMNRTATMAPEHRRISFQSPLHKELFTALTDEQAVKVSPETADRLQMLKFKGEVLLSMLSSPEEELRLCRRELERECIKEELEGLTLQIRESERIGTSAAVDTLLKRFQELSSLLKALV